MGSSLRDLRTMPSDVKDAFGGAFLDAQYGDAPEGARPFGEGLPSSVLKLAEEDDGRTYRAAYTVAFGEAVYVLHIFQKKSVRGIATPQHEKDVIRERLKQAEQHWRATYQKGKGR